MAGQESLGDAVLYLTVNDEALRQGIGRAKEFVRKELGQAFSAGTGGGRGRSSGTGGRGFSDRVQATQVITRRLGDQLQRLADKGIDVTKQFRALDRASVALNKGLVEVARAQNKGVDDFIRNEKRRVNATRLLGGAREGVDEKFKAQKRRYSLDQQIRSLETAGVKTDKFRASLGEITAAQARREFGLAKQLGDQLSFNLRKERDRLKVKQQQIREGSRVGRLNVSPILGGAAFPESPKRRARDFNIAKNWGVFLDDLRDTAEVINATKSASAQAKKAKQFNARQSWIPFLEDLRDTAQVIENTRQEKAQKRTRKVKDSWTKFLRDLDDTAAIIEKGRKSQGAKPAAGGRGIQGRISSGLVGGAFPLLFGQGAGAAIGGGLGGFAGGSQFGFGLSLVGTVIGSAFDEAINKGKELGAALRDPISSLSSLASSSVLSSSALEKQVTALTNTGRAAEAATLAQIDLLDTYGDTSGLEALAQAQGDFDRTIAKLQISVANFVSGPLTDFINKLNEGVKKQVEPPTTQPTLLSQGLGLAAGGLALGAGVAATTGLGLPLSFGLLGGSALLAGAAQMTDVPSTGNVEENLREMEKALALVQKMRGIRASQKALDDVRLQIAKEEDRILSLQLQKRQVQLAQERALQELGDKPAQADVDKIKLDTKIKILEIERRISDEVTRRDEKQKKAAQDLQNLRLQNIKFLGRGEKQALIKQVGQPAIQEAQRRGVTLRSFSDIRDFAQFLERERTLQNEAGPALINSNQDLRTSLESTAEVVRGLVSSVDTLSNKEWNITVTVPGQNSSQKQDLVNSLG